MLKKLIKIKTLKMIASDFDWGENKKAPSQKGTIANKIFDEMEPNPKKFLEKQPTATLKQILKDLDIDLPDNKKEYVPLIVEEIESVGLQNLFSSFTIEKLKEFADDLKVRADSSSQKVLIECIISLEDYEAPPTSSKSKKPSEKKPPIDKNITKTDLAHHYYREDLIEYCKDKELTHTGTKKELIDRIYAFVSGKDKKRGRNKPVKAEKSDEEKSEKSEKSDKEKSDKNKKEDKEKEEKDEKEKKSDKEKEDKKEKKSEKEKEDKKSEKEKEEKEKKSKKEKSEKSENSEKSKSEKSEETEEPPKKKSKK